MPIPIRARDGTASLPGCPANPAEPDTTAINATYTTCGGTITGGRRTR